MLNRFIIRVRNFLVEKMFFSTNASVKNDDILLVKLDKLGDYILFRNFIEEVYKQHHASGRLVLCGNVAWKELAEKLDGEFIDKFIWVNPAGLNNYWYRFSVIRKLRKANCNKIIHCSYSRTNEGDLIVRHSRANEITGFYGDETNMPAIIKKANDAKYTMLVPGAEECMFEFYRNKLFFEYIFKIKIPFNKPYIKQEKTEASQYIAIFPGAGHSTRRWSASNFASLCNSLYQLYKLPIYVCGVKNEMKYAEEIIASSDSFVVNNIGRYSLPETVEVIRNASLVITNDSGPLHLAMAVETPTLCISNGNHFQRFCPYPKEMEMPLVVVFPGEFEIKIKNMEANAIRCKGSDIDINSINPDKVLNALKNSNLVKHA